MVSPSFESSHPNSLCLYPSWHFLIRPSFSPCCETYSPPWWNLLLKFQFTCWLEILTLLHFGFLPFADILCFGIPLSFAVLHSCKSTLPQMPRRLESVVVAQHLARVWPLLPSHTLRNSFVTGKEGLNE